MGGPSSSGAKKTKRSKPSSMGRPSGKRMAGWSKGGGKHSSATTSSDEDSEEDFTLNKVCTD